MNEKIELKEDQKIDDPRMSDCGEQYLTTFAYRLDGDSDLYGEDFWREGRIVWETTAEWKAAGERYEKGLAEAEEQGLSPRFVDLGILDDEWCACLWDEFTVLDENGEEMSDEFTAAVTNLL